MKDLMGLMKQAKEMQAKMTEAQSQVADIEATGRSGAGMVERKSNWTKPALKP